MGSGNEKKLESILEIISNLSAVPVKSIGADDAISRYLHSIQYIKLIVELEKLYGIEFPLEYLDVNRNYTAAKLADFLPDMP